MAVLPASTAPVGSDAAERALASARARRERAEASGEPLGDPHRDALRALRSGMRAAALSCASAAELRRVLALVADLDDELHRAEAHDQRTRLRSLERINAAMARLHELRTAAELIEAAPEELRRALGFTRAMISRVRGSAWVPEVLVTSGHDAVNQPFQRYVDEHEIPLDHMMIETELVRRRMPALVEDPTDDPRTYKDIVAASGSTSYVVSPILPTRRVIGFLHADRFGQEEPCTEADRDALWVFAEHFGLLFERTILVERLERQRAELKAMLLATAEQVDELCHAEIELARDEVALEPAVGPGTASAQSVSRVAALLTPREREVLDLVASGATNTTVAEQLVVSEGTVKSHVKRILRKLHVHNRAEAVARYLELVRLDRGGRPE